MTKQLVIDYPIIKSLTRLSKTSSSNIINGVVGKPGTGIPIIPITIEINPHVNQKILLNFERSKSTSWTLSLSIIKIRMTVLLYVCEFPHVLIQSNYNTGTYHALEVETDLHMFCLQWTNQEHFLNLGKW